MNNLNTPDDANIASEQDTTSENIVRAQIFAHLAEKKEMWSVIKLGTICLTILVGIAIVGFVYLEALKPAWLTVIAILCSAIFGSGAVSLPVIKLFRMNTKRLLNRIKPLEKTVASQQAIIDFQKQEIARLSAMGPVLPEATTHIAVKEDRLPLPAIETPADQILYLTGGNSGDVP